MILGNLESFAIEYELSPDHGGAWMFGHVRYWIGGKPIGRFEESTSLRDVLLQSKWIVNDSGNRSSLALCSLSASDLSACLASHLFGDANVPDYFEVDVPARFNVCVPVDVFDDWMIFLVDVADGQRLAYTGVVSKVTEEVMLRPGEFDRVFGQFYRELEALYEREEAG